MHRRSLTLALAPLLLSACAAAPPTAFQPTPPAAAPAPAAPAPAAAPLPITPEQALLRLFSAEKASEAWFDAAFLSKVPIAKIDAITSDLKKGGGALVGIQPDGKRFIVAFQRTSWQATVALDEQGRFTTLLVRPAEPATATIDEALAAFRALKGKVAVVITTDGSDRGAIEPELALGTGSSFKMAILAALQNDILAKKRSWKDVVELDPRHKSLPSGFLQRWPDKAPITVHSLAALMISISDNTATDVLLNVVGKSAVEAIAPRNKPFLATGEMFKLKGGNPDALSAYQKGNEGERRKVIEELAKKPLPNVDGYPTVPTALDVEWFFTPRELCALMKKVHDLPVMSINPGIAKKADWDQVAYKGGSEPGVFSMTTWLVKGGHGHCVSATWNAPEKLEEGAFESAYAKAIVALKK